MQNCDRAAAAGLRHSRAPSKMLVRAPRGVRCPKFNFQRTHLVFDGGHYASNLPQWEVAASTLSTLSNNFQ